MAAWTNRTGLDKQDVVSEHRITYLRPGWQVPCTAGSPQPCPPPPPQILQLNTPQKYKKALLIYT